MKNFIDILKGITQLNADFDEGDKQRQDDLLKRFNSSRSVSIDLKMRIAECFDYLLKFYGPHVFDFKRILLNDAELCKDPSGAEKPS